MIFSKEIAILIAERETFIIIFTHDYKRFICEKKIEGEFNLNKVKLFLKKYQRANITVFLPDEWIQIKKINSPLRLSELKHYANLQKNKWFPELLIDTKLIIKKQKDKSTLVFVPCSILNNLKPFSINKIDIKFHTLDSENINLLTGFIHLRKYRAPLLIFITLITILIGASLPIQKLKENINHTQQKISSMNTKKIKQKKWIQQQYTINQFNVLLNISKSLPSGMITKQIDITHDHLNIAGYCHELKDIQTFIKNYKSPYFQYHSTKKIMHPGEIEFALNYRGK